VSNRYNSELTADLYGLDEPLDMAGNRDLFPLVAAGDEVARRRMIEGNLTLVVAKVDSFLGIVPHLDFLRDDLTSAGFLGLVKAVNSIARGKVHRNDGFIVGYLIVWIGREIEVAISREAPIYVPLKSQHAARAKGETIDIPVVTHEIPEARRINQNETAEVDARDLLDACCTCEEDRIILAMCAQKHTYAKIAKAIGKPFTSGYMIAKALEARIQQRFGIVVPKRTSKKPPGARSKKRVSPAI